MKNNNYRKMNIGKYTYITKKNAHKKVRKINKKACAIAWFNKRFKWTAYFLRGLVKIFNKIGAAGAVFII